LVPALEKNLSEHQLRLISLDLFDEFIRICIPSSTPVELVEAPLQQVLAQIEPTPQEMPSELARQHLADFKKGSKHS